MINGKTITLIVPCKNEASIIAGFIKRVPSYIDEILIVDNHSTDATAKIARRSGARVVSEPRTIGGIGYGFAHQTGIAKATGDYVVAMDGDDTYPVNKIAAIIRMMETGHIHFVSCNRLPLMNPHAISKTRQFGIIILNMLVRILFGYPIKDILSGMWVAKRETITQLGATCGDWNYSPEIKLQAIIAGSFGEYHINHFVRAKEPSKQQIWKTGMQHAWFIIQKRIRVLQQALPTIEPVPISGRTYAK